MQVGRFGALLVLAVALAACTGTRQISFDREFAQLNELRSAARRRLDESAARSAESDMDKLSGEAEAAAKKALGDGRKLDAIALYRVAASAAWKSRSNRAGDIARAGLAVCGSIKPDERGAPRDCIFLEIVEPAAIIDARGDRIRNFHLRTAVLAKPANAAERDAAADAAMKSALEALEFTKVLNGIRARIAGPSMSAFLPPEMMLYANEQVRIGFCHAVVAEAALRIGPFKTQRAAVTEALRNSTLRAEIAQRRSAPPSGADPTDQRVICGDILQPREPTTASLSRLDMASREPAHQ